MLCWQQRRYFIIQYSTLIMWCYLPINHNIQLNLSHLDNVTHLGHEEDFPSTKSKCTWEMPFIVHQRDKHYTGRSIINKSKKRKNIPISGGDVLRWAQNFPYVMLYKQSSTSLSASYISFYYEQYSYIVNVHIFSFCP